MDSMREMFASDGNERQTTGSSKKKELGELGGLIEQLEKMAAELGPAGPQEVKSACLVWTHLIAACRALCAANRPSPFLWCSSGGGILADILLARRGASLLYASATRIPHILGGSSWCGVVWNV